MISPRKLNAAGDRSPPVHPMLLRSVCRLCESDCTADYSTHSSSQSRRNHRKKHSRHVNGDLNCQHHSHHSEAHTTVTKGSSSLSDSNSSRNLVCNETRSAEKNGVQNFSELSSNTTKQSSVYAKHKSDPSPKSLILEKNSVFYKSFFKRIILSTTSAVKRSDSFAVKHSDSFAVKHSDSSAVKPNDLSPIKHSDSSVNKYKDSSVTRYRDSSVNNYSASSVIKKSGYSSRIETSEYNHDSQVENCIAENMSRTRLQRRMTLASVRNLSCTDSDGDGEISVSASLITGRTNRNQSVSGSFHTAERNVNEDYGLFSNNHYQNSNRLHSNSLSHGFRSASEDLNAGSTAQSSQRSSTTFYGLPAEGSSESSLGLSKTSGFSLAGWVLEASRWFFWRCIYHNVCEVLLFDSWLLSRAHSIGKKKIAFLFLLFLLPLLFLLLGNVSENSIDEENLYLQTCEENPAMPGSLWYDFWNILPRSKSDGTEESNLYSVQSNSHLDGEEKMSSEEMRSIAREVFKEESGQLLEQLDQKDEINLALNEFLSGTFHNFKLEVNKKLKTQSAESTSADLESKVQALESLLVSAKNCCKNHSDYLALIDSRLTTLLKNVMEDKVDSNIPIFAAFRSWLNSNFISYKKLSDEIATAVTRMHGDHVEFSKAHFEEIAKKVAETIITESVMALKQEVISETKGTSTLVNSHNITIGDIQKIVKEAISLYDADKTGLVDYALESGGGSVVSTRCSETYNAGTARLSVFGLPLWFISNSPRTAIQPDMQPGQCWAFKGSQGFLLLQLSATIWPKGFSLEHIPKSLSPTGTIDSAPREVSVWGLLSEKDNDGVLLAEYEYDKNGEPLQYFPVQKAVENFYSYIELKILSNWGNQKYTCLYRFRVHGSRL